MTGGTLIYSPGVRVFIDTEEAGTLDVTDDLRDGQLSLSESQMASFSCTLLNHRRKYDGVFAPNDRIHVRMKRIRWVPVFSGYLNQVPYFSVYPKAIPLSASCTIKRLKYRFWDSGTEAAAELLRNAGVAGAQYEEDGGLRDKLIALLTQVADWPRENIHIGAVPGAWREQIQPLKESLANQISISTSTLGEQGVVAGSSASSFGTKILDTDIPATGALPVTTGRANFVNNINGELDLTAPERGGPGGIGTSSGFNDGWYIQMRWPYRNRDGSAITFAPGELSAARQWWRNRRILVINPENNRAVVVRAVHWGPKTSEDLIDLVEGPVDLSGINHDLSISEHALKSVLKAKVGDELEIRFANTGLSLGPLNIATEVEGGSENSISVSGGSGSSAGETPFAPTPPQIDSATGLRFTDRRNLEGHVAAAYDFVKQGWDQTTSIGGYADRNISGTNTPSDHAKGLALDVTVSDGIGTEPRPDQLLFGNSVAQWFVANPDVFKTNYVIWNDHANYGNGWVPYRQKAWNAQNRHPSVTQGHRDHVHISFDPSQQTQPGPSGNPFPGHDDSRLSTTISGPGSPVGPGGLFSVAGEWQPMGSLESSQLVGARALLNDSPIYSTVASLVQAAMRSFMAAPNGDFIAWFPDYFGQYGTAAKMLVRDIELLNDGFNMTWSDDNLVTHQFTAGVFQGFIPGASGPGGPQTFENKLETLGIATVEMTELMEALFNVSDTHERAKYFRDANAILQRFGARVSYKPLNMILHGDAEFWYAVRLFQRAWASQFSSQINLSFMPEVYPGMLLELEGIGLQVYVTAVSHSFDFSGGGFTTNVTVVAPSATDRSGFYGLPLAGDRSKTATGRPGGGGGVRVL